MSCEKKLNPWDGVHASPTGASGINSLEDLPPPYETEEGSNSWTGERELDRQKKLSATSGYAIAPAHNVVGRTSSYASSSHSSATSSPAVGTLTPAICGTTRTENTYASGSSIYASTTSSFTSAPGSTTGQPSTLSLRSFERRPPRDALYGPFPPATHYAHSDDLTHGFPLTPPTCPCAPDPHPFLTHDVTRDDWARFLADVQSTGGLTPVNSFLADAAPKAVSVGLAAGYLASKALKAHVKSKRKSPVADVVDLWNRRFFHPRSMDVVLAQGLLTYTGPAHASPPDMLSPRGAREDATVGEYHSDNDDDERGAGRGMKLPRRISGIGAIVGAVGEQLGRERRENKNRRDIGRVLQHSARERWRIVVSYKPPVL
ncbi:hypothetical protein C8Q79DRAFT_1010919 [Trametes meyenii]|nr:hypothetical protein C8Q79DRAFT_1010919 [Trametes meyenii]